MRRFSPLAALGLIAALSAPVPAAAPPKAGTYEVVVLNPAGGGTIYCLIKLTPTDNGVDGELVAAHPQLSGLEIQSATLDGDTLRIALKGSRLRDLTFEGRVPAAGAETVLGTAETGGGG